MSAQIEGQQNQKKYEWQRGHAKYDLSIYIIFKYASETGNPNLSHASVILFHHAGFRRDDPVEIFMITETPPFFVKT